MQMSAGQFGAVPPPGPLPTNITGELDLIQGFGPLDNGTAATRGLVMVPSSMPYFSNASQVSLIHSLTHSAPSTPQIRCVAADISWQPPACPVLKRKPCKFQALPDTSRPLLLTPLYIAKCALRSISHSEAWQLEEAH